ncbi:hypothetical protein MPTK1_8g03690 [Marchantia polymorpha subsp. ruderalis]|uniref:VQ domain-containing protein n=1 Tax=Marchantia polymorpha TaxID=3197 RepID=A0A2R6XJH7_MARPO|nr:hypothetical protein MARPO_0012s0159 [Marchantia polymorpha]BBN18584.1 hypothetical protein Mp_8g03690 [Marchantia polymorpha subsp. ruderalis]|eukprot:PTQ46231.1 hypothetical protein MARPO_0012s0159 [Marchantia polymorpha]
MQATRQFLEVPSMLDRDLRSSRAVSTGDSMMAPSTLSGLGEPNRTEPGNTGLIPKYKIINATLNGPDYVPSEAQILAAEMAEEFYGTQVTFVHADKDTFKSIVQKLTGNSSVDSQSQAAARLPAQRATGSGCDARRKPSSSTASVPPATCRAKARPSAGVQKMGLMQRQKLKIVQEDFLKGPSTLVSPVSVLETRSEFEHSSPETGGMELSDCYQSCRVDVHFGGMGVSLFPNIVQPNYPKLLSLFPETPQHDR